MQLLQAVRQKAKFILSHAWRYAAAWQQLLQANAQDRRCFPEKTKNEKRGPNKKIRGGGSNQREKHDTFSGLLGGEI